MALTKITRAILDTGISDSSNATAITIDSSERVGIGLTSPSSPLHVRVTSDANFEVENASGSVRLAALNDARSVNVNMEFTSTHFGFLTGNLGLGTTTINTGTLGTANKFLEVAAGTANGSGTIILSRTTNGNNNEIGGLRFVNTDNADDDGLDYDGKLVAAISARSVTSDSNAGDDSGADLIFYTKPEAGNYTERARILSSGGLTFNGDTATANALDDYEEGTWTPTFAGVAAAAVYGARYTKIGQLVMVEAYIAGDTQNNTNQFRIGGLPFTSHNVTAYGGGSIQYVYTQDYSEFSGPLIPGNSTYIYFHYITGAQGGASVTNNVLYNKVSGNQLFIFQAFYRTA